jgi:putative glutamine amidotransferase
MRLELETRRFYLGRDYSEALQGLGAVPTHLSLIPDREYISDCLKSFDGILLPGSDTDIDPHRFGEEPHPKLKKNIFEKDETDALVIEEAEKLGLPILAICYGMQALNVFRGGTLVQDIESQIENFLRHEQGIPLERNSHSIDIEENSRLLRLITTKNTVRVNSHHHQAVKTLGKNLKATAWAKDGVVECIEDIRENCFVLGVQWHPELSWKTDELSRRIFETFIEECK